MPRPPCKPVHVAGGVVGQHTHVQGGLLPQQRLDGSGDVTACCEVVLEDQGVLPAGFGFFFCVKQRR